MSAPVDDLAADDAHWAFGTSFADPLAGVDTTLPDGVDGGDLAAYCLMLGDDALVAAHRLSAWCSTAPDLEEDVALANIALDLLGQARLLLVRAAAADPGVVPPLPPGSPVPAEDALAFFRDADAYRCVRLVEPAHGDFGETVARLLCFATWRLALLERLRDSADPVLAAVAGKGVKELAYHRDHAARWVVTLARGTAESRRRVRAGLLAVGPHLAELARTHPVEARLARVGVAVDPADVAARVDDVLAEVLRAADLEDLGARARAAAPGPGGRDGRHTPDLATMLAEMQVVARAHPSGRW
ncbi:1,2-phenylacetyl-CoA epoxidase subunit PaaC [Nocardioides zeae]